MKYKLTFIDEHGEEKRTMLVSWEAPNWMPLHVHAKSVIDAPGVYDETRKFIGNWVEVVGVGSNAAFICDEEGQYRFKDGNPTTDPVIVEYNAQAVAIYSPEFKVKGPVVIIKEAPNG